MNYLMSALAVSLAGFGGMAHAATIVEEQTSTPAWQSFHGDCQYQTSLIVEFDFEPGQRQTVSCTDQIELSKPTLAHQATHDLSAIQIEIGVEIYGQLSITGVDPDWTFDNDDKSDPAYFLPENGSCDFLENCEINSTLRINQFQVTQAINSGTSQLWGETLADESAVYLECRDAGDPLGLFGSGTCREEGPDIDSFWGQFLSITDQSGINSFLNDPFFIDVAFDYEGDLFSTKGGGDDDIDQTLFFHIRNEITVSYIYTDKPPPPPPPPPSPSEVPVPASLPLMLAGIVGFGLVSRHRAGPKNDHPGHRGQS